MNTYRIYKSVKKIGADYYEAEYIEYDENGRIKGAGYEDFSKERLRAQMKVWRVRTYTGKVMHGAYREGWRMTEVNSELIRLSARGTAKIAKSLAIQKYGDKFARLERV